MNMATRYYVLGGNSRGSQRVCSRVGHPTKEVLEGLLMEVVLPVNQEDKVV